MTLSHRSELIVGGARSGKSRYAIAQANRTPRRTAFVATAEPLDAEMRARIARHRAERPRDWTTVEEPFDLVRSCRRLARAHDLVVVDCLTLWVSNLLLRGDSDERILAAAEGLAGLLAERALSLLLVSNEVGASVHPPTEAGLRFQALLGVVNQHVAAAADRVTLMVAGIPVAIKDAPAEPPGVLAHERPAEAP